MICASLALLMTHLSVVDLARGTKDILKYKAQLEGYFDVGADKITSALIVSVICFVLPRLVIIIRCSRQSAYVFFKSAPSPF